MTEFAASSETGHKLVPGNKKSLTPKSLSIWPGKTLRNHGLVRLGKRYMTAGSSPLATLSPLLAPEGDQLLVNASAVGYYGFRGDEWCDEETAHGDDFLANLACDWEIEARKAEDKGARVIITRIGVILGSGGALENMITMFSSLSWRQDRFGAAMVFVDSH